MKKNLLVMLLAASLVFYLPSCKKAESPPDVADDIVTQTIVSEGKTQITLLVKNAFSVNAFEREAEKKFPDLDIIQVGNYTHDMGIDEYEARLKNDDLTDMVMTWPVEVGEEYWEDRLMDLSALPITLKYNMSMLNNITKDGKLYYLPGPSQIRGIIYNKTLFEEKGWQVPKDFEGFISLCKTIEESGIRPLQLGFGNSEVLDTAFIGYSYGDCFAKPGNANWIKNYNKGIGSFGENFAPALETFQRLIDEGILKKGDLNVNYADREYMLFGRECAMTEDSTLMTHLGYSRNGCTDEFALMPFFNPGENNDWARIYPVCYIGVNKHLEEAKNKEKYDLVMQLLEYISTEEGQKALEGDTGSMFSALKDMPITDDVETLDLVNAIAHGRCAVFPTLKNAQRALRKGLGEMVAGISTAEDVVKMVDRENLNPPIKMTDMIIGEATKDFTVIETGNFVTDAMRKRSGCEIALFMDNGKDGRTSGKGISGRLYKGDLTNKDVGRILPDLKKDDKCELWKITMTGEDLIKTLEYSIPVDNNIKGWFYYFSGLKMEFAPWEKPGQRISKITDNKGNAIELDKIYTIAVMDYTVPDEFMKSCEKTGELIRDIVVEAIEKTSPISPSEDGRFVICKP